MVSSIESSGFSGACAGCGAAGDRGAIGAGCWDCDCVCGCSGCCLSFLNVASICSVACRSNWGSSRLISGRTTRMRASALCRRFSRASTYCGAGFRRRFDGWSYVHSNNEAITLERVLDPNAKTGPAYHNYTQCSEYTAVSHRT